MKFISRQKESRLLWKNLQLSFISADFCVAATIKRMLSWPRLLGLISRINCLECLQKCDFLPRASFVIEWKMKQCENEISSISLLFSLTVSVSGVSRRRVNSRFCLREKFISIRVFEQLTRIRVALVVHKWLFFWGGLEFVRKNQKPDEEGENKFSLWEKLRFADFRRQWWVAPLSFIIYRFSGKSDASWIHCWQCLPRSRADFRKIMKISGITLKRQFRCKTKVSKSDFRALSLSSVLTQELRF